MNTEQFLKLVTPEGILCIAKKMEPKGYSQIPVRTHEDAAKVALHLDSKGETVFYALASFKETHLNDYQQERVKRARTNVDKLKALWLDIDFKVAGGLADALGSLTKFLTDTGFAKPTAIVHSGNGIHVYWALVEAIPMASDSTAVSVNNGRRRIVRRAYRVSVRRASRCCPGAVRTTPTTARAQNDRRPFRPAPSTLSA